MTLRRRIATLESLAGLDAPEAPEDPSDAGIDRWTEAFAAHDPANRALLEEVYAWALGRKQCVVPRKAMPNAKWLHVALYLETWAKDRQIRARLPHTRPERPIADALRARFYVAVITFQLQSGYLYPAVGEGFREWALEREDRWAAHARERWVRIKAEYERVYGRLAG